ncbi:MAG TPA: PQQ-binding-like beta-propeller repeat protein [Ktedonobacteraceae bacterium]|nr:PQQ-binding-like beta-propeller repeat protein [Ktedonobacteraceae bacterium]
MKRKSLLFSSCLVLLAILLAVVTLLSHPLLAAHGDSNGDWPTFLNNGARTGTNALESMITAKTAHNLHLAWTFKTGGVIAAEPITANGVLYIGSWDGYEYALNAATGTQLWRQFLGLAPKTKHCPPKGITSTATVENGVLYAGGGDGNMYALSTANGAVIWKTLISPPPYYNWSSPLIYNNELYIGLASNCDAPQVQGKVLALNISDGSIAASVSLVQDGHKGAPVWSSPAVDVATNTVYVTTGNNQGQRLERQPNAEAFLSLDASSLAIKDRWQIPGSQNTSDGDFGATPTLFDYNGRYYIGALNKNGIYYVLDRTNLAAGPLWQQKLSNNSSKVHGDNISSSCYNNGVIFTGSAGEIHRGQTYGGAVGAFAADTGKQLWFSHTPGKMLAPVTCTSDLVVDTQGSTVEVRAAATGSILFSYKTRQKIYGASLISNGFLYATSTDATVYAFNVS